MKAPSVICTLGAIFIQAGYFVGYFTGAIRIT